MKLAGILTGILVVLLTAFHLWFISRAKILLEQTVEKRSNGKLKLEIDKLSYNYFNHHMVLKKAVFLSTDTNTAPSAYRLAVPEIRLRLKGLTPLLLRNELLIDSLQLFSPDIRVTTIRPAKDSNDRRTSDVSIPYEMGKVYNSIQDALKVLRVTKFQTEEAAFTLENRMQPSQEPLKITHIYIQIDNLQVDQNDQKGRDKMFFSDNVIIRSRNQQIHFPGGRHQLAFSGFRINLKNQLVEFDSCTIAARRTDSTRSSFRVFFDTLRLTRIDFDTLYRNEVIKADSVYCLNPDFTLIAESGKKKTGKQILPRLENIVQQLTGDLLLGYVGVRNADFHIRLTRNGVPNSYTFTENNFEMRGLTINQDEEHPIRVRDFEMAIRNYQNFLKDSVYNIRFDSVRIHDDQVSLSNFMFLKLDGNRVVNSFKMPRFRLEGLSWNDLVFENKLKARSATMIRPDINFTSGTSTGRKKTLFHSLGAVDEFMDLDNLNIEDGSIDLKLRKDLRIQLEKASISVRSQSLLRSTQLSGIRNSLNQVRFNKGIIRAGNRVFSLHNWKYDGETERFSAGSIHVSDDGKNTDVLLENLSVDKLLVDEFTGDLYADGIGWSNGLLQLDILARTQAPGKKGSVIELKNLHGKNTLVSGMWKGIDFNSMLRQIRLGLFDLRPGKKPEITGLSLEGDHLDVRKTDRVYKAEQFSFLDEKKAVFSRLVLRAGKDSSQTHITIPKIEFVPHLRQWMNGEWAAENGIILEPLIRIYRNKHKEPGGRSRAGFPELVFHNLKLIRPELHIDHVYDSGFLKLDWYKNRHYPGDIILEKFLISGKGQNRVQVLSAQTEIADLLMQTPEGLRVDTRNGSVQADIREAEFLFPHSNESPTWNLFFNRLDLKNFQFDTIGKYKGLMNLDEARIRNLLLHSSHVSSLKHVALNNALLIIERFNGQYADPIKRITWKNAGYDASSAKFTLDSFSIRPVPERDSFFARQTHQVDYITAGSGRVVIGPVKLDAIFNDSLFSARQIRIENPRITIDKDKRLTFRSGYPKPLPVALLKKIPFPVSVENIILENGKVLYTEFNDLTNKRGEIPVSGIQVHVQHAKNYDLSPTDSLDIKASGDILDSIFLQLLIRQSYTDTSGGFLMTAKTGALNMALLNKVLVPLSNIEVLSGTADSLYLTARGREYLATGKMKFLYRKLKIRLLREGEPGNRNFKTRMLSFLANHFVLRTNNKDKTHDIFQIRDRDRSAINYYLRIILNGIKSSTGAVNTKKQLRRFRRSLKQNHLPDNL